MKNKIITLCSMIGLIWAVAMPMQAQALPGDITTVASGGVFFVTPKGVGHGAAGVTYVADSGSNKVVKVTTVGTVTTVTAFAGTGLSGTTGDGGLATAATFTNPWDVAVDTNGDVYVADKAGNNVRKIAAATGIITTVVGGTQAAFTTTLSAPSALSIHAGILYIVDTGNNRVVKYNLTTGLISMAVNGVANPAGFTGDGSFATLASLNLPSDISFDPYGNYYIADTGNYRIRKVDVAGNISTVAGSGVVATSTTPAGDWDVATNVALNPLGVTVDTYGNVYFTDDHGGGFGYQRLVQMFADGTMVTVSGVRYSLFPGGALAGGAALGTDAAASKLPLFGLSDVEVGANGEIYFVESGSKSLRKLTPDNIAPTGVSLTTLQAPPVFSYSPLTVTNSTSISLMSACTDYSMCAQMQFSNDGVTWNPFVDYAQTYSSFYNGVSYDVPYTLPTGDGVKTVYARFRDRAGNVSTPISQTITLDTTAPAAPIISVPVADSYVNTWANTVSGTAEANASLSLFINGSSFPSAVFNVAADGTWSNTRALNQNVTTTFQAQVTDVAGNVSPLSAATSVTYDTAPPSMSLASTSLTVEYGTAYVPPTVTVTDNIDGAIVPTITGGPVDTYTLGTTVLTYQAQDRAGNLAQRQIGVTVVDTTPPVITVPADITVTATDSLGIQSGDSTVQAFLQGATAADNVDGTLIVSNDAPTVIPVGGVTVTFTATDYSGNTTTATGIINVQLNSAGGGGGSGGGGSNGGGGDSGGGGGCIAPTVSGFGLLPMLVLLLGGLAVRHKQQA